MKILRNNKGFTAMEVLLVASLVTAVPTGAYMVMKKADELVCRNNLRQIALGVTMFDIEEGKLPQAAFYPENPESDKDSIKVILKPYVGKDMFVCPSLPDELRKKGLTYLWNDAVSGKMRGSIKNPAKTWLMVEMNAVSRIELDEELLAKASVSREKLAKVPGPHRGGYNILYVDGQVEWSEEPPKMKLPGSR